ncbi:hypothetical protein AVEN_101956-1 [Araneus ventricosus]|uniref:Secreted protein n=1 Tax=Araneus ventricosus TaxID=182803 RepID=A0A4Y2K5C0_ARAVE|nr:hypothetical protein AVEN_101956-1 [Araneus ventricosus]
MKIAHCCPPPTIPIPPLLVCFGLAHACRALTPLSLSPTDRQAFSSGADLFPLEIEFLPFREQNAFQVTQRLRNWGSKAILKKMK